MGVYINMEMPKEGFVEILIRDDGTVQKTGQSYRINGTDYYTPYVGEMPVIYQAVSVPPHGRLIDADALPWEKQGLMLTDPDEWGIEARYIEAAPTIIPEDKEKKKHENLSR